MRSQLTLNMAKLLALLLVITPILLALEANATQAGLPHLHPRMVK
jgi:hypothetical protein